MYRPGDLLGPLNIKLIQRTGKRGTKQLAIFECPYCGKNFQSSIQSVSCGDTKSCGCKSTTAKDITNQRFGRLIALYRTNKQTTNKTYYWHCKCDCGKEVDVKITSLLNGQTQSCGCYRTDLKAHDLTNQHFGELIALQRLNKKDNAGYFLWRCKCSCGNETIVNSHSLVSGNTKSCGHHTSLNEYKIAKILKELNIPFVQQKTFANCRNPKTNSLLKFDFFLPEKNICIEYDGQQHFIAKDFFGGKKELNNIQERDSLKNLYCKKNNIKIIRISYLEESKISKNFILNKIIEIEGRNIGLTSTRYGMEDNK